MLLRPRCLAIALLLFRLFYAHTFAAESSRGVLFSSRPSTPIVLTNCSAPELAAALAPGGQFKFGQDCTVRVESPFIITHQTSIDADGHSVVFDGGGSNRLFQIENTSASFTGLRFENGRQNGMAARVEIPPAERDGTGGAILATNSTLILNSCTFSNNYAQGGAGDAQQSLSSGSALGGAIYADSSKLFLTNSIVQDCRAESGEY